jgi:sugar phosphate isomerase/epimerase
MNSKPFRPEQASVAQTRRSFLKTAAASTALAMLARPAWSDAPPAPRTPKVVVGGHPWVYAATLPGFDITPVLPQIFSDMKYAGLDGIELMDQALLPDDATDRIGELSRRHQLPVIGMSFGADMWNREMHQRILDDAGIKIPRLAKLGGRTLGTSVGPIRWGLKIPKTPQQLDDQADLLRKLIALCEAHGVVLNLHNHTYEVENDMHDLRGTLARIPGIKLGPDLNWLVRAGVDPVAFIRQFAGQIVFMHLRDQKRDGRWSEAMGEGDTDFVAIGRVLHEINFTGDAMIELAHERDFKPTRPLRDSFRISREFVRNTMGY